MRRRTRGETRAMRDVSRECAHHHGLLSRMDHHAALVSMLAKGRSTNEAVRQYNA